MSHEGSQYLQGGRRSPILFPRGGWAISDAYLWQVGVGCHKPLLTVGGFLHYLPNFDISVVGYIWPSAKRLKFQGTVPRELDQGIRGRC